MPLSPDSLDKDWQKLTFERILPLRKHTREEDDIVRAMEDALELMREVGASLAYYEGSGAEWTWGKGLNIRSTPYFLIARNISENSSSGTERFDEKTHEDYLGRVPDKRIRYRDHHNRDRRHRAEDRKYSLPPRENTRAESYGRGERGAHRRLTLKRISRILTLHIASQMYILNTHPPEKYYNKNNSPSVNEISALVHMEHMEDGMAELSERFPELMIRASDAAHKNKNQGNLHAENERIPCSLAWEIHDYFIQDFICLGYEMPAECLKEECKAK